MRREVRDSGDGVPAAIPTPLGLIVAGCLLSGGIDAHALDFRGSVAYEAIYSDNVEGRKDGTSDWEHAPSVSLGASHDSSSYALSAQYRIQHRVYAQDSFPDDTVLGGSANARVTLIPETLDWLASHSSTESSVSSRAADSPDNSQTTTVTSTGPQARFRVDARTSLAVGASLQQSTASRTRNDSMRWSSNAALDRSLDGATTVGLSLQHSNVDFDSEFGQDYRSSDARITFGRQQGERTRLRIEVGGAFVSSDGGPTLARDGSIVAGDGDDNFNWTGLLSVNRELSSSIRASLSASRSVVDSGSNPGSTVIRQEFNGSARSDQSQSYLSEVVQASISRSSARLSTRIGLSITRQSYEDLRDDETRRQLSLSAGYALGPRLSLNASASIEQSSQEDVDGDELRRNASVGLNWMPWRNLGVYGSASWSDRDSEDRPALSYDETSVRLGLSYGF